MKASLALLLNPRHRPAWRWLLAMLVLVVAWFAFTPSTATELFDQADKVKHVLAFGCLAGTAALGWPAGRPSGLRIACALVLYGAFIEVVQSFIPGRDASWLDLAADAVGIAAGLLAAQAARLAGGHEKG
jgi:VanZ family protein